MLSGPTAPSPPVHRLVLRLPCVLFIAMPRFNSRPIPSRASKLALREQLGPFLQGFRKTHWHARVNIIFEFSMVWAQAIYWTLVVARVDCKHFTKAIVADNNDPLAAPDLTVETHMTIRGQAIDHQALSKFVRALFEEPAINDVNVQRTSLTNYANGRVVEFDITVVLNSRYRES